MSSATTAAAASANTPALAIGNPEHRPAHTSGNRVASFAWFTGTHPSTASPELSTAAGTRWTGIPTKRSYETVPPLSRSSLLAAWVELDHALPGHVLDPSRLEGIEDAVREFLRDRDGSGHRADADLRISSWSPRSTRLSCSSSAPSNGAGGHLNGWPRIPIRIVPESEPGGRRAFAPAPGDRVVLQPLPRIRASPREVIVRPKCDSEHVGVVRTLVRRHPSPLGVDRHDPFLAELGSSFEMSR